MLGSSQKKFIISTAYMSKMADHFFENHKNTPMAGGCVQVPDQWCDVHEQSYSSFCRKNFKQFLISCA